MSQPPAVTGTIKGPLASDVTVMGSLLSARMGGMGGMGGMGMGMGGGMPGGFAEQAQVSLHAAPAFKKWRNLCNLSVCAEANAWRTGTD